MADNFLWKFREMKSIMFHGFAIFSHFLLDVLASDTETTLGDAEDRFLRRHRARLPDDLPLVDRQLSIGTSSAQATGGASSVASSSAANLLGKYFRLLAFLWFFNMLLSAFIIFMLTLLLIVYLSVLR